MNGCLPVLPECRYVKGKEEGGEKGCFAPEHHFLKIWCLEFSLCLLYLKIVPKTKVDLTKFFDSADLGMNIEDWADFERILYNEVS